MGNLVAAVVALWDWRIGLVLAPAALAGLLVAPKTPRYRTDAPIVERES